MKKKKSFLKFIEKIIITIKNKKTGKDICWAGSTLLLPSGSNWGFLFLFFLKPILKPSKTCRFKFNNICKAGFRNLKQLTNHLGTLQATVKSPISPPSIHKSPSFPLSNTHFSFRPRSNDLNDNVVRNEAIGETGGGGNFLQSEYLLFHRDCMPILGINHFTGEKTRDKRRSTYLSFY